MNANILLVEDDANLGFVIKDNLEQRGYGVSLCRDGEEGEKIFSTKPFDVCLIDVMLPRQDGFALASRIRESNKQVPILFVTAKSMLDDKIAAFRLGADDYLTKPFSMEELVLRIEVFLRRTVRPEQDSYRIGRFEFDCRNFTLQFDGAVKSLTQKEAEVLQLLCQHKDRVLRREEILKKVWGDDDYFMGRSMDVFISKLRKYLRDDSSIQIVNYHGVGFKLEMK